MGDKLIDGSVTSKIKSFQINGKLSYLSGGRISYENKSRRTAIIEDSIKNYNVDLNVDDVGTVIEMGHGIAHIFMA